MTFFSLFEKFRSKWAYLEITYSEGSNKKLKTLIEKCGK